MRSALLRLLVIGAVSGALAACSGSSTSPTTTTSSTTTATNPTNDILTGTVGIPVNGTLQSSSNPFTVSLSGGTITITMTSAVETLPDNTLLSTVTMGLSVGTWANNTCTPIANAFTVAQGGSTPHLSGTINAGAYCVTVSDVTNQVGPVNYAVAVSHY